jgi:hypothetical protein
MPNLDPVEVVTPPHRVDDGVQAVADYAVHPARARRSTYCSATVCLAMALLKAVSHGAVVRLVSR